MSSVLVTARQDALYERVVKKALDGQPMFSHPDKRLTFPASVFFECKCDKLKLIVDLVDLKTAELHGIPIYHVPQEE